MGCTQSHLELGEEAPSGHRWFHDLRRRRDRCDLKNSAELSSESPNAADDVHSTKPARRSSAPPLPSESKEEAPKGKKKAGLEPRFGEEGKGCGSVDERERAPGSPSFRFYFDEGAWIGKDSAEAAEEGEDHGNIDEKKE